MMRAIVRTANQTPVVVDLVGHDRIRARSSKKINAEIARRMEDEVRALSGENKAVISARIDELDREWDIDRALMILFPVLGGLVLTLGLTKSRKWFGLLSAQLGFIALHAAYGWSPPVSVLRPLGFRSRFEIDAEKYALKTIRGDFATDQEVYHGASY